MTKLLTAADILNAPDKVKRVEIKSAGGWVNVKRLSPADNEKLSDFYMAHTEGDRIKYSRIDFQALMMSLLIVGEDGRTPIFTPDDLEALRQKDDGYWLELYQAIQDTNPTGTKDDIKEAKENLSEPQAESSGSK